MEKKNIYIDIDSTICKTVGADYPGATPLYNRIEKANKLYTLGHHIVYWTARGTKSGIDWYDLSKKQLDEWGVLYHELKLGKPAFDLFIDDKVLNSIFEWNDCNVDKIIGEGGEDNTPLVYNFQLDPNKTQWSGSVNMSVFYDGKLTHIDDLPMEEQIRRRLQLTELDTSLV